MRIDSAQVYLLPAATPHESVARQVESIVVSLRSGQHTGWGDVALTAGPVDEAQWSGGAFVALRDCLLPAVLGQSIDSGEALQERLELFRGQAAARSALELAWWNLLSAERQRPLVELLGGQGGELRTAAVVATPSSPDELLAEIGAWLERGAELVVLKLRPGWSVEMVRGVRRTFPNAPLAVDCDGLCTMAQLDMFYRLQDFFLKYIEQPFAADDLVAHAMLQEAIQTPVSLDQSLTSLARVEQAIDLGAARQLRIAPRRLGGLTVAIEAARVAHEAQLTCCVGCEPHSPLAASAATALATRGEFSGPAEIFASRAPELTIAPSSETSSTAQPDAERLAQSALETISLS